MSSDPNIPTNADPLAAIASKAFARVMRARTGENWVAAPLLEGRYPMDDDALLNGRGASALPTVCRLDDDAVDQVREDLAAFDDREVVPVLENAA